MVDWSSATSRHRPTICIGVSIILLSFGHPLRESPTKTEQYHKQTNARFNFSLGSDESYQFFDDIPNEVWMAHKRAALNIRHHENPLTDLKRFPPKDTNRWHAEHWHPYFTCPFERMVGKVGDGHKWVCDPHRLEKREDCLVYSVGCNNDFSFETDLYKLLPNCEIHIFDMGDYADSLATNWTELNATYHQLGLTSTHEGMFGSKYPPSGKNGNGNEFRTFPEIINTLGHEGRQIDVLKVDCENCEWGSYHDWLSSKYHITQVLVETHYVVPQFWEDFHNKGYVLFHKEPNTMWQGGCEWSFLKLKQSFHCLPEKSCDA